MSKIKFNNTSPLYSSATVVCVLTAIGLILRLNGISFFAFSVDENWHIFVAGQKDLYSVFIASLKYSGHPPLLYFIWHYIIEFFGNNEFWLRFPTVIIGTATIPIFYILGKKLFKNESAGLFFAFICTFSILTIEQSQLVRGYSFALFFSSLAIIQCLDFNAISNKSKKLKILLRYFIFALLALLFEFAVIQYIFFCSLYLLYTYLKAKDYNYKLIVIYIAGNSLLLLFLLLQKYLISTIGGLEYIYGHQFSHEFSDDIIKKSSYLLIFFIDFIYSAFSLVNQNFYAFFKGDVYFTIVFIIEFISIIIIMMAGLIKLAGKNYRKHALIFIGFVLLTIIFDAVSLVPIGSNDFAGGFERRHISLFIPFISLLYLGLIQISKEKDRIGKKFASIGGVIALLILFITAFSNKNNSNFNFDFDISIKQQEELRSFVKNNTKNGDIALTDWISILYLNNTTPIKLISDDVGVMSNNIYFHWLDYRTIKKFIMPNYFVLDSLKEFSKKDYENILIFRFGFGDKNRSNWKSGINSDIRYAFSKADIEKYNEEIVAIDSVYEEFFNELTSLSTIIKIEYEYSCEQKELKKATIPIVKNGKIYNSNVNCKEIFIAYKLSKENVKKLVEKFDGRMIIYEDLFDKIHKKDKYRFF